MSDLAIDLKYDIKNDKFYVRTNVKQDKVADLVSTFLQGQVGAGKDEREAADRSVYSIKMRVDLSDDSFETSSDTNNYGLRDGILMRFAAMLEQRPESVEFIDDADEFERRPNVVDQAKGMVEKAKKHGS